MSEMLIMITDGSLSILAFCFILWLNPLFHSSIKNRMMNFILGHSLTRQLLVSIDWPASSQSLPLPRGSGLLHARSRNCAPSPHSLSQTVHSDQSPYPPSISA